MSKHLIMPILDLEVANPKIEIENILNYEGNKENKEEQIESQVQIKSN